MYPTINGTLVSNNLAELLVYANSVTYSFFAFFIVLGFFVVVFVGSMLMQLRFNARIKPETSLIAGLFATLGWAVILEQYSGILSPIYFFVIIGFLILAFIWNAIND